MENSICKLGKMYIQHSNTWRNHLSYKNFKKNQHCSHDMPNPPPPLYVPILSSVVLKIPRLSDVRKCTLSVKSKWKEIGTELWVIGPGCHPLPDLSALDTAHGFHPCYKESMFYYVYNYSGLLYNLFEPNSVQITNVKTIPL